MKKILLYSALPVSIAVALFTCSKPGASTEKEEINNAFEEGAIAVSLVPVQRVNISRPVSTAGLLATKSESRLSFKIGGLIRKIYVKEGQTVQRGQTLAALDLTEIDAQVNQAKNNVEKLKRDLERIQRLYQDSAATLEMVQNTQTAYNVAVESKSIAEFNREYATIKAPNSGKILKKFLNEGELASPGTPVFYVNSAGRNEWIIKLSVADVDWVSLKLGDKAIISLDIFKDEKLNGEVSLVGEGADPFTGMYPVEVSLAGSGKRLASGLFAIVEITPSDGLDLYKIPIETIVEGNGSKAYVFIPGGDNQHIKKIQVGVAFVKDSSAFIKEGLEGVSNVIVSGSGFLTDSSIITIKQ